MAENTEKRNKVPKDSKNREPEVERIEDNPVPGAGEELDLGLDDIGLDDSFLGLELVEPGCEGLLEIHLGPDDTQDDEASDNRLRLLCDVGLLLSLLGLLIMLVLALLD